VGALIECQKMMECTMNNLRKMIGFLMVLMLATFALPSGAAQQKLFNVVFPTFITSSPFTVTFNNTSPGNSTINSISIAVTPNVSFSATDCAGTIPGPATLTLQADGSCVITNFPGILSNTSRTFQLYITFASGATCANATWTVNANTGNTYPQGTPFTPVDQQLFSSCDGTLACQDPQGPINQAAKFSDAAVTVTHGSNKDGLACNVVPFDITDFIIPNQTQIANTVRFKWDTSVQPNASFITTVHWNPAYMESNGLPKPTQVAYNLSGPPVYVPLIACLSPNFPTQYGTLSAFTTADPDTITITINNTLGVDTFGHPFTPIPPVPFVLAIGTERMNAINLVASPANTYNVKRHQGGTSPFPLSTNLPVMSTSLPLNASGIQQQACLVLQDITVVTSSDTANCNSLTNPNAPNPPPACAKVDTTILFEGDPVFNQD
jgi:hypothetical protein